MGLSATCSCATFLARADEREGTGLPGFVRRELYAYLDCGILANGFARVHCSTCGLCSAVQRIFVRTLLGWLKERAESAGICAGRSGAVVVAQRFGSALNLNLHFHALALDGVYSSASPYSRPVFQRAELLSDQDVIEVTKRLYRRILRYLTCCGRLPKAEADESSHRTWERARGPPCSSQPPQADPVQSVVTLGRSGIELARVRIDARTEARVEIRAVMLRRPSQPKRCSCKGAASQVSHGEQGLA